MSLSDLYGRQKLESGLTDALPAIGWFSVLYVGNKDSWEFRFWPGFFCLRFMHSDDTTFQMFRLNCQVEF